jgi:glycosyltransferase involved in cell wall biosynthesis
VSQVTAVLITCNEEADIARALSSVQWCDEIVVVDSGSTDRTVEICRAHGCKVFQRTFNGFGEQKTFAVAQASNNWVLIIDSDEEVTPALRDEIRSRLQSVGDCRGFYIRIITLLWDQVLRPQKRHTCTKLRLFDKRYGKYGDQLVHESVMLNGPTGSLHEPMYNHSYASIDDYFEKFNRYTSAAALQMCQRGKRAHVGFAVFLIPLRFIHLLLIKGFIFDGAVGVMWSLFSSFYPAVKYLKLWQLRHSSVENSPQKVSDRPEKLHRDGRSAIGF